MDGFAHTLQRQSCAFICLIAHLQHLPLLRIRPLCLQESEVEEGRVEIFCLAVKKLSAKNIEASRSATVFMEVCINIQSSLRHVWRAPGLLIEKYLSESRRGVHSARKATAFDSCVSRMSRYQLADRAALTYPCHI